MELFGVRLRRGLGTQVEKDGRRTNAQALTFTFFLTALSLVDVAHGQSLLPLTAVQEGVCARSDEAESPVKLPLPMYGPPIKVSL